MNGMSDVFLAIAQERERQNNKFGPQNHSPMEWLPILMEEVGEAAKAALEPYFQAKGYADKYDGTMSLFEFRKEMIQVAAVAVAIVESLDRNELADAYGKA